jgi:agmatine deiminase
VYGEIARVLADFEPVEILCHSEPVYENAGAILESHAVRADHIRLHLVPNDRTWLRDSAPTAVVDSAGAVTLLNWSFNAWAKYANWRVDALVGRAIADIAHLPRLEPTRPDNGAPMVLEGGGIETNGAGLLLVTEEWLLSSVQVRNPGLTREGYEQAFRDWLGARTTIWLGEGCAGDDTHGHVDDIARFVANDTIVLAVEEDPADENHARSMDNVRRLELASRDPQIGPLKIVHLPYPRRVSMNGERLPASYANFYIGNGVVLMPTFNDPNDRAAMNVLAELMPRHQIVGLHAVDLVWGLGTVHCLTQQEPLGSRAALP